MSNKYTLFIKQRETLDKLLSFNSNAFLFGEAGVGKTAIALSYAKEINAKKVVILTTATLKKNWQKEASIWYPELQPIVVDKTFPDKANSIIIHYNQLEKFAYNLRHNHYDLIIIDESQYLKNPSSKRTIFSYGGKFKNLKFGKINADRFLLLSGTPADTNKDLYTTSKICDPLGLGKNKYFYEKRYCGGRKMPWGWETSRSTNTEELVKRINKFTVKLHLKDVIDLPALHIKTTLIPEIKRIVDAEQQILNDQFFMFIKLGKEKKEEEVLDEVKEIVCSEITEIPKEFKSGAKIAFEEIAKVRSELAHLKLPDVCDIIETYDPDEPLVIFGHHKSLLRGVYEYLGCSENCSIIDGNVKPKKRQNEIDKFVNGETQYFLGSVSAAGEGITLVRSNQILLIDPPQTATKLFQVIARVLRIGQERDVHINIALVNKTIDIATYSLLSEKSRNILEYRK